MEQPIPPLFDIPELEYVGDFYVIVNYKKFFYSWIEQVGISDKLLPKPDF